MLASYLISLLRTRYGESDLAAFVQEHPEAWLVWEPGPWSPSGWATTTNMVPIISDNMPPPPTVAEALAMQLKVDARHPAITVGRGEEEAFPINDATLSRTHLILRRAASGWTVEDANSSNGTWVKNTRLEAGKPYALEDGSPIQAGRVYLTYFEPAGMLSRIKQLK